MRQIRLRETRKELGLSVRALAELVDVDHSTISRIESGERGLSVDMAEKLGQALNKSASYLLGIAEVEGQSEKSGFSEDAEPYNWSSAADVPITLKRGAKDNVFSYSVKSSVLDCLDYKPGDILFIDIGQAAVNELKPGQCVLAQYYSGMAATTILRQFISPSLLITNSRRENFVPLNLDVDDVAIKGVVVGQYTPRNT